MMKYRILTFFFIMLIMMVMPLSIAAGAETIKVYTYHNHPPFINDKTGGITFSLESYLNKSAKGKYLFEVHILPRNRLNVVLKDWVSGKCKIGEDACESNWVLLWVNQKWGFGKEPEDNFLWVPLLQDSNSIISRMAESVVYKGPESLKGLRFGGMSGHKYVGIDTLVAEGAIDRIDGSRERDNVLKLYKHRVDVILLPSSTINYLMENDSVIHTFANQLYIAPVVHQSYTRNVMIPGTRNDLHDFFAGMNLAEWIHKAK
ncbi:MAG: hypothetical protein ISR96_02475 [Nitrospira sp.]|nr:hypothetical protein [Nitrospira sp.]